MSKYIRFTKAQVCRSAGISPQRLNQWTARHIIDIHGRGRQCTADDFLTVVIAAHLVGIGFTISVATLIARAVVPAVFLFNAGEAPEISFVVRESSGNYKALNEYHEKSTAPFLALNLRMFNESLLSALRAYA